MSLWSVIRYLTLCIFFLGTKLLVMDHLDSEHWFIAGWVLGIIAAILNTIMSVLQDVLIQE
jgi:hypothetical protein